MKFAVALVFVAICAMASGNRINNKSVLSDILGGLFERIIPELANLNIASFGLGNFGSLTNLTLYNVETLEVVKIEGGGPFSLEIKELILALETASATTQFDLRNISIPELNLLVNGIGDLSGSADKLSLSAALLFTLQGLKPRLEDYSSVVVNVEKITAFLTDIDNSEATHENINTKLAPYLVANIPLWADQYKTEVIALINSIIEQILNGGSN